MKKTFFAFCLSLFAYGYSIASITITPGTVPNGNIAHPYTQTLQAVGGSKPYAWAVSAGSLPAGLTLISGTQTTANLAGTPTTAAVSSFTVQVTDVHGVTATQGYTVTVTQIILTASQLTTLWCRSVPDCPNIWDTWNSLSGTYSNGWSVTGNTGLTAGTNFLGNKDSVNVVFKTNNLTKATLFADGKFYLGLNSTIESSPTFCSFQQKQSSTTFIAANSYTSTAAVAIIAQCTGNSGKLNVGYNMVVTNGSRNYGISAGNGDIAATSNNFFIHDSTGAPSYFRGTVQPAALTFNNTAINTTAGDAATINGSAGRFRKDNSGATFTLTNSFITANSIIVLQVITTGLTAGGFPIIVPGSGTATITFQSSDGSANAPNATADINFIIVN